MEGFRHEDEWNRLQSLLPRPDEQLEANLLVINGFDLTRLAPRERALGLLRKGSLAQHSRGCRRNRLRCVALRMSYSAHGWCGARKRQVIDGLAAVRKFVEHGRLGCARRSWPPTGSPSPAVDGRAQSRPPEQLWWSGEGQQVLELMDHRACIGTVARGCVLGEGLPSKPDRVPERQVQGRKRWDFSGDQHQILALEVVGTSTVLWIWRDRPLNQAAAPPLPAGEPQAAPSVVPPPSPSTPVHPVWFVLLPLGFLMGRWRRTASRAGGGEPRGARSRLSWRPSGFVRRSHSGAPSARPPATRPGRRRSHGVAPGGREPH